MDIEKLQEISKNNDFSRYDIVITGGEPSLHTKYLDIVRYMVGRSKTVTVTSNGTLDLKLNTLKDISNLYFQISLDGAQVAHDAIRGKGSFETTYQNILKLDSIEAKYSVASVVSRKNRKSIFELLPFLEKLNSLRYWRISYEMPFGSASTTEDIMSAEEWNDFVNEMLCKARLRLKIQKLFPFELYDRRFAELEQSVGSKKRSINCGSGVRKIYVYPTFDVYPCTCLTDFKVGNLSEQTLDEILNSEMLKTFSEYMLDDSSECNKCDYKSFCNGGCIGMSYHYFGKLGMGDLRCPRLKQ